MRKLFLSLLIPPCFTMQCAAQNPDVTKQTQEYNDFSASLHHCEAEAREAGHYAVFEPCMKEAGL